MRAHRRDGIAERGAVLDGQPLVGVSVVRAPDLRRVVEHARVKASAAARAALDQELGIARGQPLEELVEAEHVVVEDVALALGGGRVHVGDRPVEVPLDVLDIRLVENRAELLEDVLAHLSAGEVENELRATEHGRLPRDGERPVGMCAVEVAVLVDHLGLEPEPEPEPEGVDLLDELRKSIAELGLVNRPVAQTAAVVVPQPEPPVVEDEHVDAQIRGLAGEREDRVAGEVEVHGLPAVDDDGPRCVAVPPAADVPPDAAVEVLRELVEALVREGHDDLGGHELLARVEQVREPLVGEAELHAGLVVLVVLDLAHEVTRVDEAHRPAAPGGLVGALVGEDHHRVVLV